MVINSIPSKVVNTRANSAIPVSYTHLPAYQGSSLLENPFMLISGSGGGGMRSVQYPMKIGRRGWSLS